MANLNKTTFLLLATLLCYLKVTAHDFEVNGIYYTINGNEATVTYCGASYNEYSDEYSGFVTIPRTVSYNGTIYTVTAIGERAFDDCTSLTGITIPNSVTTIGDYAFCGCTGLTNIDIPNSVISIGKCAFTSCRYLTSVTISNQVTSIEDETFAFCSSLESITIPNSVTSIGVNAFAYSGLRSVTIPSSVTHIDDGAFFDCNKLNIINIPYSVIDIGSLAFHYTRWYNNQPNGLIYLGSAAYSYKGPMPAGTIDIQSGTKSIAGSAFSDCMDLVSISIPNSVRVIGKGSFQGCEFLTNVILGDSLLSINKIAFGGCRNLKNIRIPNSVTSIGFRAFMDCFKLENLTIGKSVETIDDEVFVGCNNLRDITCLSDTPPIMQSENCFTSTTYQNAKLIVSNKSEQTYRNTPYWYNFNQIASVIFIESLALNKSNTSLCVGDTEQLFAEIYPENSTNKSLTWISSDPSVATINPDGIVTAKSVGTATITATTKDGSNLSASCTISIEKRFATSISINKSNTSLNVGETEQLNATVYPVNASDKTVTWTSSNPNVATVSSTGSLTAVSVGNATITAKTADGSNLSASCSVVVYQLATSISLNQTDVTIYTGNTLQLNATVSPSTTSNPSVTWSSSNTSVATVSSNGVVTAKSTGTAVITVRTTDGTNLSAQCFVTVKQYATSISLNQTNATIYTGNTLQLTATVSPSTTSNPSVTWSSSNTSVATVSSSGVVTAKSTGSAVITAKTADGSNLSASCNVTVKQLATSISLNKTSETLYMGNTLQLIATVSPSNTSDKSVSWSSSNIAVATVSSDGLVTPKSTGTATITVRTEDGSNLTAQCVVTVKQYATSISLNETDVSINTGNTFQLYATVLPSTTSNPSVTWSSSNTSVATVSSTGMVTAKSTGDAVITAKTADGSNLSASCNVTVKRLATSISLNKTSATLYLDQTVQLTATVYPNNATDRSIVWSSSDNSVATVSSTGLVTAIMPGTATITATTADGSDLSATCEITVNAYVTSLTLDPSEVTILEGDTIALSPVILPTYATNQNIYWSSNNTSVATVSNGIVVGRSGGETTITARTADGTNLYAYCKVTVVPNFDISAPTISHIRGSSEYRYDLTIDLANRYDITGMQFDMQLPDGVTIAEDGYGEYDIVLDDARKTRNHTATASSLGNNTYRILVSSATANSLKGHYGTVLHIMIEIPLLHVSGNKQIRYTNIILSEPDETRHALPSRTSLISYYYKEGDANADVNVDVSDYVITGNCILQNSPENFWYDAANVDHNSTIDVNDLTGITNIALGRREGGILQMPAIQQTAEDDIELDAKPLEIQKGQTKTLELCLNENFAFAGFQMDMQLPEGLILVDASLTDGDSGLSIATAELPDGSIRLLASSFSLKDLAVNNSSFLRITLSAEDKIGADGRIILNGIKFSKRNMALHTVDHYEIPVGNGVSSLEQVYSRTRIYPEGKSIIIDSPESGTARIVTIAGISLSHEVKPGHNVIPMDDAGLYIVTLNGTTAKLYLK